jgi:hypothetical protein
MCLILLWGVAHWLQAQTLFAPTPVAGNFQTVYGKEYKNATVSRVEPDGILLRTKSGISKVYFVELPKEVQERFHYDAAKAAQFTTVQQSAIAESNAATAAQQQQQAAERQRALEQQQVAAAQQRQREMQQEQIAAQQQQRQLKAQQKQDAKIAAQKQAREQHHRRTTGGLGDHWESYRHTFPGGYEEMSGNAQMGHRHSESHPPHLPNEAWTDNSTDEEWGPAPNRNKAKKRETPSP